MTDRIYSSSSNQSLDYTPAQPDEAEAEANMCVAPEQSESEPDEAAARSTFKTTHGDNKIHREGVGLRVDPSGTTTGRVQVMGHDVDVSLTGVDALVAATDRNADGSQGVRLAASGNVFQGTATLPNGSGGEFTVGFGVGAGIDASSGTRDADRDGNVEYCVRAAWNFVVLGGCSEAIPALVKKALGQ